MNDDFLLGWMDSMSIWYGDEGEEGDFLLPKDIKKALLQRGWIRLVSKNPDGSGEATITPLGWEELMGAVTKFRLKRLQELD